MAGAAAMDREAKRKALDRLSEAVAAIFLSLAAFASSWAAYQAALWDGEQAASYSRAEAARVAASRAATQAGQVEGADILMFSQWLNAYAAGETELQAFYRARFRPAFADAFETWLATNPRTNPRAAPTPFAMRDYRARDFSGAARLEREADALFDEGQRANDISDAFVRGTVIMALALFLGGIVQTFESFRVRFSLLTIAGIACLYGLAAIAALPAIRPV